MTENIFNYTKDYRKKYLKIIYYKYHDSVIDIIVDWPIFEFNLIREYDIKTCLSPNEIGCCCYRGDGKNIWIKDLIFYMKLFSSRWFNAIDMSLYLDCEEIVSCYENHIVVSDIESLVNELEREMWNIDMRSEWSLFPRLKDNIFPEKGKDSYENISDWAM